MLTWLSNAWSWVKDKWTKFEAWVYSWMPGFKTKTVAALGAIGYAADAVSQYISGLPLATFATATQISIATAILFTLAFWFKRLGDKYGQ